jgi:hypothetical protein
VLYSAEVHLGIIAANVACGRHIYSVLRYGRRPPDKDSQASSGSNYRSRTGYLRSADDRTGHSAALVSSQSTRARSARSEESDIPLRDGIKTVTEYTVETYPASSANLQHPGYAEWAYGDGSYYQSH